MGARLCRWAACGTGERPGFNPQPQGDKTVVSPQPLGRRDTPGGSLWKLESSRNCPTLWPLGPRISDGHFGLTAFDCKMINCSCFKPLFDSRLFQQTGNGDAEGSQGGDVTTTADWQYANEPLGGTSPGFDLIQPVHD